MITHSARSIFALITSSLLAACGPESLVDSPQPAPTSTTTAPDPPSDPPPDPLPDPLPDPGVRLSQATPMCVKQPSGSVTCHLPSSSDEPTWELSAIEDAVEVVQSLEQGCVLHATGRVSCWGFNHHGQLGLAVKLNETSYVPVELPEVEVVKLTSGHHVVCGIRPSGQAICWGGAYEGPLGDPDLFESQAPVEVLGVPDAVDIAATMNRVCAVRAGGGVVCWKDHEAPVVIEGISDAVKISVNPWQGCAIRATGEVVCWDDAAQLTPIANLADVVQLSGALLKGWTCARTAAGGVTCWTVEHKSGSIGAPVIIDDADAVDVSASSSGVCAVRSDGSVDCWTADGEPSTYPLF